MKGHDQVSNEDINEVSKILNLTAPVTEKDLEKAVELAVKRGDKKVLKRLWPVLDRIIKNGGFGNKVKSLFR